MEDLAAQSIVNDDKILKIEAQAAMKEVRYAVTSAHLSENLDTTTQSVYMNIETKENQFYCVQLTVQGFRVVGKAFDVIDEPCTSQFYETIYALLDSCSPEYRQSFGDALMDKLAILQQQRGAEG